MKLSSSKLTVNAEVIQQWYSTKELEMQRELQRYGAEGDGMSNFMKNCTAHSQNHFRLHPTAGVRRGGQVSSDQAQHLWHDYDRLRIRIRLRRRAKVAQRLSAEPVDLVSLRRGLLGGGACRAAVRLDGRDVDDCGAATESRGGMHFHATEAKC